MTAKVQNYDQVKERLDRYEKEYSETKTEKHINDARIHQLTDERDDLYKQLNDTVQKSELLKMDKVFLTKEYESYRVKSQHLEDSLERKRKKVKEMKKKNEELFDQLLKAREDQKGNYEQRLQAEIDKIRQQTNTDLEHIKENAKEVSEREWR